MSERVILRPVTAADLNLFEVEFSSEQGTGIHQWFGFTSMNHIRRQFADNGLLGPDGGVLAVECSDGEMAGRVEWFTSTWGRPETSTCWTIAAGLRPANQGHGIGTEAQRLLVEYLFLHTRAERIQAFTDVDNKAEQRALEKVGMSREGILRSAQWRHGAWHDQALYSIVRSQSTFAARTHRT